MKNHRRVTVIFLSFVVACTVCLSAFSATGKVTLDSGNMNVRKSPSTDSAKIASVKNGAKLEILGEDGEWFKVKVKGKTGYVKQAFIEVLETETPKTKTSVKEKETKTLKGVDPEFKEYMDSYEAFFDEYCAFMKKYTSSDSTDVVGMLSDYSKYMKKYAEYMDKLEAIKDDDMSLEELAYYSEVMSRILEKISNL